MIRVRAQHLAGVLLIALSAAARVGAQERVPADQSAPSEVRVVKDRTTIWTRNPSMVLAVVKSGTVLRAIAREDRWIEVLVPPKAGGKGNTGFVLAAHVEHIAGTPDVPVRNPRPARRREAHRTWAVRLTHPGSPYSRPRSAYAGSAR